MAEPALYALTPTLRAQLRALYAAKATTADTSRLVAEVGGLDADRLVLLERMGLACARKIQGRVRWRLTPAGVAEARKPSEANRG